MQIFILDEDPQICARYHANKHVLKQILESAQLLCTTMRLHNIDYGYKITHKNHPCRLWLEESQENFLWLKQLGLELCCEYTFRYGKIHKSQCVIENTYIPKNIPKVELTPFVQAIPIQYKSNNVVKSYRQYYMFDKKHLVYYTKREMPIWLKKEME